MDIQGGRDAVKKMKEAGNDQGKVVEVPHAGVRISLAEFDMGASNDHPCSTIFISTIPSAPMPC